eukprot:SAG11_NODE_13633_length_646_cov_0.703839_1_plen_76_part_10
MSIGVRTSVENGSAEQLSPGAAGPYNNAAAMSEDPRTCSAQSITASGYSVASKISFDTENSLPPTIHHQMGWRGSG